MELEEYGKLKEEYIYSFDKGKTKEISYSRYDESGEEDRILGFIRHGDGFDCDVLKWNKESDSENIFKLRDSILLGLDRMGISYNFSGLEHFLYDHPENENEDGFELDLGDGHKIIIQDYPRYIVHNKHLKTAVLYDVSDDKDISSKTVECELVSKDFGVISTINHFDSDSSLDYRERYCIYDDLHKTSYIIHHIDNLKEPFMYLIRKVNDDGIDYDVLYDKYNMVDRICTLSDDGIECFSRNDKYSTGFEGAINSIESIYPTMITPNDDNHKYKFLQLWSHDILHLHDGEMTDFQRYIYEIDTDKFYKLLNYIREDK